MLRTLFIRILFYARSILPERRQREQTATVLWVPFTTALTFLMFGFQARFVLRCEWDTFCPNTTPFPQILHFAIYMHLRVYVYSYFEKSAKVIIPYQNGKCKCFFHFLRIFS